MHINTKTMLSNMTYHLSTQWQGRGMVMTLVGIGAARNDAPSGHFRKILQPSCQELSTCTPEAPLQCVSPTYTEPET